MLSLLVLVVALALGNPDGSCSCGGQDRGERVEQPVVFGVEKLNQGTNNGRCRMKFIQGGQMLMGSNKGPYEVDGEAPREDLFVDSFWMAETETSVEQFREFVTQTHYETDAERFGWSFVFEGFLSREELESNSSLVVASSPWFNRIDGASWKKPFGINHGSANSSDPVVHVSWNEASLTLVLITNHL